MEQFDFSRCYQLLELEYGASLERIEVQWRDLTSIWHPDKHMEGCRYGQALPRHPGVEEPQVGGAKPGESAGGPGSPREGIARGGTSHAWHCGAVSWPGLDVVTGFAAVVLLRQWPHVRQGEAH